MVHKIIANDRILLICAIDDVSSPYYFTVVDIYDILVLLCTEA